MFLEIIPFMLFYWLFCPKIGSKTPKQGPQIDFDRYASDYMSPDVSPAHNTLELFPNNPPPLSVSALFICVTREATWPELPRASGDWEQETGDKFPETARDQASKYVSD